jgi:hypothetical protein
VYKNLCLLHDAVELIMVVGYEDKEQLKHDRDKMGSKISKTCP